MANTTEGTSPDADARSRAFVASSGKLFWDVSSRSLSFLMAIVLARRLGADGFGRFAILWYTAWMLAQATDLGLHVVGLRRLSRHFRAKTLRGILGAKALLSGLAAAGIAVLLATKALDADAFPLALLLFVQLAGSWVELGGVVLRSRGGVAREGVLLVVLRSSWLVASVLAVWRSTDLRQLAIFLALASLPALFAAAGVLRRRAAGSEAQAATPEPGPLVRDILPLAATSVVTLIYLRADLLRPPVGSLTTPERVHETVETVSPTPSGRMLSPTDVGSP